MKNVKRHVEWNKNIPTSMEWTIGERLHPVHSIVVLSTFSYSTESVLTYLQRVRTKRKWIVSSLYCSTIRFPLFEPRPFSYSSFAHTHNTHRILSDSKSWEDLWRVCTIHVENRREVYTNGELMGKRHERWWQPGTQRWNKTEMEWNYSFLQEVIEGKKWEINGTIKVTIEWHCMRAWECINVETQGEIMCEGVFIVELSTHSVDDNGIDRRPLIHVRLVSDVTGNWATTMTISIESTLLSWYVPYSICERFCIILNSELSKTRNQQRQSRVDSDVSFSWQVLLRITYS